MKFAKRMFAALLILGLFACAKPPQAEIDAAKAAVAKAAANSDVVMYASEALARAQDALSRMQTELTAKKYDKVKTLALEASAAAEKAITEALANKEKVKADAAALIAAMKKALPEAEKTITAAKRIPRTGLDFAALAKALTGAKASLTAADADYANGNFKAAWNKATAVQTALADGSKTVADAVQAATKKK
ncbi:MAG: DUF4398 domain-containing protein [Spirochaetes bacterium]|nr:DUF4398 domain-containing protein [Spirochaetota bacterium]